MAALKDDQIQSVQKSYFNILALFLGLALARLFPELP